MRLPEADGSPPVNEEMRQMQIKDLKTSIERAEYAIDPEAVAAAIVAKLLQRHTSC